jgi:predicted secreted protein with PEFG-CTERM motif
MKTKAICSFFVLFAIAAVMVSSTPAAFADHTEVAISTADTDLATPSACLESETGCYTPGTATVDVGGVVTMTNADATAMHTYTSGTVEGYAPSPDDKFDSGVLNPGDSWILDKELEPGTYPYYCMLHVWMQATLIVQEAEAAEEEHVEDEVHEEEETHEEELTMENTMVEDEVELMVTITDSAVLGGTQVDLEFSELHVNYEITATQDGEEIFKEATHSMELTASHQVDAIGSDESPIDIEIVSLGIGPPGANQDWTGPTGSVATSQVVPEFGTIAMMILAVAIISIVAVTAKSRVVPRF